MKNNLFIFLNKYKYHFLIWSIFISYELIMERFIGLRLLTLKEYFFAYSLEIIFFYSHACILLNTFNTKNRILKYSLPLLVISELGLYLTISFFGEKYLHRYIDVRQLEAALPVRLLLLTKTWRGLYFTGLSTIYCLFKRHLGQRKQIEQMKEQELKTILFEKEIKSDLILTQNALLRSQINPHFLINTLSYLYNVTRKTAPKAADSILYLSDIMQYALSKEISSEYVKLESEIRLIESFLFLNQAKQKYKVHLKLSYNSEALSILIIPLILMSLTENIIKHGQLDNPLKPAEIKIIYKDSILYIKTSNSEATENQISTYNSGLKNIFSRLLLAYGERATFNAHLDSQNYFHTYTQLQF